jgi:hypothetical protein
MFWQHFFLFSTKEEVIISQDNVRKFHYLSEVFENSVLFSTCEYVIISGHSQSFFLDSDQFA